MEDTIDFVIEYSEEIDCLILGFNEKPNSSIKKLWQAEVLLPAIIMEAKSDNHAIESIDLDEYTPDTEISNIYHEAEIRLYPIQLKEINSYIQLAINKFLDLATEVKSDRSQPPTIQSAGIQKSLISQQQRLSDKLKQRLSQKGLSYKRDSKSFWLNLSSEERQKLDHKIRQAYRQILLIYFDDDSSVNRLIDELVDLAFFADISTSQIIEIHMELIDNFAYQLKIEGRNDDVLLDYRLPLIDVVSHLCEVYRRSIPKSDVSTSLLFAVE